MTVATTTSHARRVAALAGVGTLAASLLLGPASAAAPLASDWTEIGHSHTS
jgi:hypothetical protein